MCAFLPWLPPKDYSKWKEASNDRTNYEQVSEPLNQRSTISDHDSASIGLYG